jgi:hypothetical protein
MLADDIADRITIATPDELDGIVRDIWTDHTHGLLSLFATVRVVWAVFLRER